MELRPYQQEIVEICENCDKEIAVYIIEIQAADSEHLDNFFICGKCYQDILVKQACKKGMFNGMRGEDKKSLTNGSDFGRILS